ncbi:MULTISPECIES: enoyl-CoA hydratase [unclassified Rhodococcus (in: high G+C Gram-positive bacteria)]|uniref:enoyl-CoA hydratase n=1 Tax=unclassified Rhodococcus (in: high G+C Gram-positive bacteria) TaxID=192944 RepID=UPI0019F33CE1|nr:enoyl-CoA hydratase [Rhodococcus sp. (in: high G+C Gram-positive bacteria)]MBF0660191.1 enoyl-CoA hydratase [Rhodococcus sp. (in: high G+C Gram-positive bacteria)]
MTDTSTAPVLVAVDEASGIGVLTLNNARQRNTLSVNTMREVIAGLIALSSDTKVIVIRAEGPAFSAGHNLRDMIGRTLEEERAIFETCNEMMKTVQAIPQPVIASVQGPALAAGCQLVAACDLAVAADSAEFGTPGVRIGLFCSTPMVAVSRAVGRKRALQMLLTGDMIDARTAADWGLVNFVVEAEALDTETTALAVKIAAASPVTVRIGKEAFYRQIELPQDAAYEAMAETMATNAVLDDAQEGMSAFVDKRAPVWTGR